MWVMATGPGTDGSDNHVHHREPRVGRVGDGPMLLMGHSLPSRPLRVVSRGNYGLALWRLPDGQEDVSGGP